MEPIIIKVQFPVHFKSKFFSNRIANLAPASSSIMVRSYTKSRWENSIFSPASIFID